MVLVISQKRYIREHFHGKNGAKISTNLEDSRPGEVIVLDSLEKESEIRTLRERGRENWICVFDCDDFKGREDSLLLCDNIYTRSRRDLLRASLLIGSDRCFLLPIKGYLPPQPFSMGSRGGIPPSLSLMYSGEKLKGCHRSGWEWVVDALDDRYHDAGGRVLLDHFCDATFLWKKRIRNLPYRSPWIGMCHHALSEEISKNSARAIVEEPLFKESLDCCAGLICFSDYMANYYRSRIPLNISVISIPHPTELSGIIPWSLDKYQQDKKIINVGAWYRNPWTIYTIEAGSHRLCSLKGKSMNSYFPYPGAVFRSPYNIWSRYAMEDIYASETDLLPWTTEGVLAKGNKVEIIETLSDREYDETLASSIVFLDLIDASAVNTILECIARSIPLLVNPLPAVIEYLGSDYPLYYRRKGDIPHLLEEKVVEAHEYLEEMDKGFLSIDSFVDAIARFSDGVMNEGVI